MKGIIHQESLSINGIRSIIPDQQSLQYFSHGFNYYCWQNKRQLEYNLLLSRSIKSDLLVICSRKFEKMGFMESEMHYECCPKIFIASYFSSEQNQRYQAAHIVTVKTDWMNK